MNLRLVSARTAILATVVLTIAIAVVGFILVRGDINRMRDSARENALWNAMQVEIELMRFQRTLAEFGGEQGATSAEVNARFDILWSRVSQYQQGDVGERLRSYDRRYGTISALFEKMHEVEAQVVGLQQGDRATALEVQQVFNPFASQLRRMSQAVLHGEEAQNAALREELTGSAGILTAVSGIALLGSALMIFLFARDSNRFRVLAALNERLARASDRESKAKSQFLAMMSHELRTPMNGVMGHLALMRDQDLSQWQVRLLEQAERSGQQMISLLADILDFTAIQDDKLKLESKPLETDALIASVRDMFQPVASREGITFEARLAPDCPARVIGDFARLRQALTHLATYILETAGTSDIVLELGHEDGCLTASLSFDYDREGGEWHPELIMGDTGRVSDSFATEALGPAVSRGLIARMGGTTKLHNPADDRIAVLVSVPAAELIVEELLIRLVCQSASLEAICRAAFPVEKLRFIDDGSSVPPHVVLIEAGGDRESDRVARMAKRYPGAMLVALGRPQDRQAFDEVVDVPIDLAAIRKARFMRLAGGEADGSVVDLKLAASRQVRYED